MLRWQEKAAPLKRNVTQDEVGTASLYLLSDLASGVTGQIQYVDCGFNIIGMFIDDEAPGQATELDACLPILLASGRGGIGVEHGRQVELAHLGGDAGVVAAHDAGAGDTELEGGGQGGHAVQPQN